MCEGSEGLLLRMADIAGLVEAAGARFSSLELIGQGSFGDVYKGYVYDFKIGAHCNVP